MSIGPSTLGNLLVQRLDSALGISQTTQHRTGAHPDALRHTQSIQRLTQGDNPTSRSSRESVDRALQSESGRIQGRSDARLENQLQKYTDNRFTPSAPTTLGKTARTILALLTQYSHQPVQGQRPLVDPRQPAAPHTKALPSSTAPAQAGSAAGAGATATAGATAGRASTTIAAAGTTATAATIAAATGTTVATAASAPTPSALQSVTQAFAQALQHNVQQSGLFYESKLAQLVKGQISADTLQQQPQAHAQQRAQNAPTVLSQLASPQQADAPTLNLQQSGIEPSTQQLVRQQLEVLANQVFNWRGEAWPGVPLELEIERRHEDEDDPQALADEDETTPWQTRLKLQLPTLGDISARLHIQDNTVRLHITAPDSADRLKNNLASLVDRLEAQGIGIQQLQIVREDETHLDPAHYYDEDPFNN